jgi:hypothetical protein
LVIVGIGESLLAVFDHGTPELERIDLYLALGLALAILGVAALIATRPPGTLGALDQEMAIGHEPIFAPEVVLTPADEEARRGPLGTIDDLDEGDILYARSGALARVLGKIPGGTDDFGRRHRGYIYAKGLYGASDELWIPAEAVMAVYPESDTAFLAVKGDETESFGWNRPPEGFRRR